MAFFGYLFLWCLLTVVMAYFWGIIAGLAVTTGFHLLGRGRGVHPFQPNPCNAYRSSDGRRT